MSKNVDIKHIILGPAWSKKWLNILFTKCNSIQIRSKCFNYNPEEVTIQIQNKIYTKKMFLAEIGEKK